MHDWQSEKEEFLVNYGATSEDASPKPKGKEPVRRGAAKEVATGACGKRRRIAHPGNETGLATGSGATKPGNASGEVAQKRIRSAVVIPHHSNVGTWIPEKRSQEPVFTRTVGHPLKRVNNDEHRGTPIPETYQRGIRFPYMCMKRAGNIRDDPVMVEILRDYESDYPAECRAIRMALKQQTKQTNKKYLI